MCSDVAQCTRSISARCPEVSAKGTTLTSCPSEGSPAVVERYKIPTIYPFRFYVIRGGSMSYDADGADAEEGWSAAAGGLALGEPARGLLVLNAHLRREGNLEDAAELFERDLLGIPRGAGAEPLARSATNS
jgi:hypothetical protein